MVDITYYMVRDPPQVSANHSVVDAAILMKNNESDAVIITQDGKPIGIFTEWDLTTKVVAKKMNPQETKVETVMTSPIESIDEQSKHEEVLKTMKEKHYRHMPVVDNGGKLIGLVTIQGLLHG